jgi:uncharacterized protein YwgA
MITTEVESAPSQKSELDAIKLLVALLYAKDANGRSEVKGITRLEKLIFLAQEEGLKRKLYNYVAYDYGPWSSDVHDYLEALELRQLVKVNTQDLKIPADMADLAECYQNEDVEDTTLSPKRMEIYQLTKAGEKAGRVLWERLSDAERMAIAETKRRFNTMSLYDLMRYVYASHDEYARKSRIRDKIMHIESSYGTRPKLTYPERDQE